MNRPQVGRHVCKGESTTHEGHLIRSSNPKRRNDSGERLTRNEEGFIVQIHITIKEASKSGKVGEGGGDSVHLSQ